MSNWKPRYDLIESGPDDRHFVVEIDNDGIAHLRFGDGELGFQPPAGMTFSAHLPHRQRHERQRGRRSDLAPCSE